MSVLIKGMTIPNTCEECNLESFCDKWIEARKMCGEWKLGAKATIRHPECPLVPIPPHGDLIDRDGYAQEIRKRCESTSEWYKGTTDEEILTRMESALIIFTECSLALKKMPTIIEKENE